MPPSPGPAVPEQDLDDARPLAPEGEQMARECVLLQRVLNQHRKPIACPRNHFRYNSLTVPVCTENLIRVYRMMESARLAQWLR